MVWGKCGESMGHGTDEIDRFYKVAGEAGGVKSVGWPWWDADPLFLEVGAW